MDFRCDENEQQNYSRILFSEMDYGTLHSSRRYNNEGDRVPINCVCWGNNL